MTELTINLSCGKTIVGRLDDENLDQLWEFYFDRVLTHVEIRWDEKQRTTIAKSAIESIHERGV